jgi:hypothetical protein
METIEFPFTLEKLAELTLASAHRLYRCTLSGAAFDSE